MARYDEHEAWGWFLKHPNASIRLQAWEYLTDRRDGKPKQAVDISGNLNHSHVAYRDPRLAGSSDEELTALDALTRKMLPPSPDIQANSNANGASTGLRTPLPEKRQIIAIPAPEPQPDGAA